MQCGNEEIRRAMAHLRPPTTRLLRAKSLAAKRPNSKVLPTASVSNRRLLSPSPQRLTAAAFAELLHSSQGGHREHGELIAIELRRGV